MPTPQDLYEVRRMNRLELDFAIEAAAAEGWNPGLADAESFFQADPEGFFVGVLDGRPIGCISAISYEGRFGFLGLYIVLPEFRGRGYGIQLWNAAMNRLAGHTIGLDGVVAQQANYCKSGFRLVHRNIRMEGAARRDAAARCQIVDVRGLPFEAVARYDRICFPAARNAFLKSWLTSPTAHALAWVEEGRLAGYGVIRPCRQGHKIGPLFADRLEIAHALFQHLAARPGEGEQIFLDIPETNLFAVALAQDLKLTKVFETARMYTGDPPVFALDRVFGVTTFELG